ncbi:molybdopterin oxidoreductase family protein [Rhodovibrionaceae bacterium A322]
MGNPFATPEERVVTSPKVSDEVKTTTCYMCACRCGIRVHLRDMEVRYIEGNPDHPVNRGVLCAKGSAGIMQHKSPARLSKPLLRDGPRGEGRFKEIEWEEALGLATDWLGGPRQTDPRKLAFFTGRDQSQALTGWWAKQYGTPNYAAHGGFCSVNIAAGGLYTLGSSFWEFGEPDWENTKYLMMFGVAEDHDSNPLKIGLGQLKREGQAKVVSVNPIQTGYSAIADEWIGIRPGSDGLLVLALVHELLKADKIDLDYLARYSNASWLVIEDPDGLEDGLFARNKDGRPLAWDGRRNDLVSALDPDLVPRMVGEVTLPDGRTARPVFELLARRYLDDSYAPAAVEARTGVPAATIRRLAAELAEVAFEQEVVIEQPWTDWTGRHHDKIIGRPVSFHAMRGVSAHANGFQTTRALHLLQLLLGSVDVPGGFRAKAPFPKPIPPGPHPAGREHRAGAPLNGMPLGFTRGPEDLLVEEDGTPIRIDHAFSWDYPIAAHGLMHLMLRNAWAADPYEIDVLFMYMANMSWNSAMNLPATHHYLTDKHPDGRYKIPKIIYSDAYDSEMVAYADLVLPDTTYLERWDCISLLDRPISTAEGPGDAIRQPVVAPDRDVRPFQDVLIDLGARLGLPGFVNDDGAAKYPDGYADYLVNHERLPGIGSLAGWRGEDGQDQGRGAVNPRQLESYIENGCNWHLDLPPETHYLKQANKPYLDKAKELGWIPTADPIFFQIYSEPLARFRQSGRGLGEHPAPKDKQARLLAFFDPLPVWYPPHEEAQGDTEGYPLHALSQRPMQMYHSWGSQNAWLRQITARNLLHIHPDTAKAQGLSDQDWVWVISAHGKVKAQIKTMAGVNRDTVWTWNAIGKRSGAWGLDPEAPEARKGFLLNHIIPDVLPERADRHATGNADPVTGQAAWFDLRVTLEPCSEKEAGETEPALPEQTSQALVKRRPFWLRYGAQFGKEKTTAGAPQASGLKHREWLGGSGQKSGHGKGEE